MAVSDVQPRVYSEIVELFAAGAPPPEILRFQPSAEAQERVRELLAKNQEGTLTLEEEAELDQYAHVEHLMRLVRARARAYLQP